MPSKTQNKAIKSSKSLSDMTQPTLTSSIANVSALVEQAGDHARAYMRASRAENTRRTYAISLADLAAHASPDEVLGMDNTEQRGVASAFPTLVPSRRRA